MRFSIILSSVTAVAASYDATFDDHFSTEEAVKLAPRHDLSDFGYHGGMLPRVYDLTHPDGPRYLPRESWDHFNEIKMGRRNVSEASQRNLRRARYEKRDSEFIEMQLEGTDGIGDIFHYNADQSCKSASNPPYKKAIVTNVDNAYITFWTSDVCNGGKGSMNPSCNSVAKQTCDIKSQDKKSFRVYAGCHDSHGDDGCS
ncbi:hypothetical protein F4778DRAFT_786623 [Xylariomycetidae sp. FL2044]|nr:hypothetical protein F4778DRAFT_786623 [Xylariomycetidae sp. FL2044]